MWTSGQLPNADVKVLSALSACGDYETGRNCVASLEDLIALSGVSYGTVKRSLRRLKDLSQLGGAWVVATYRPRKGTVYDLCLERLATRPPQEQQTVLPELASPSPFDPDQNDPQSTLGDQNDPDQNDPQTILGDQNDPLTQSSSPFDLDHFDPQTNLGDQNDPQTQSSSPFDLDHFDPQTNLGDQNDPQTSDPLNSARARGTYVRTSFLKEQDQEHTHTPRERDPASDLPLVGAVPPVKCLHHLAHAWCDGRVHVPRLLHLDFLERLDTRPGEDRDAKAGRLVKFYADTLAAIPATQAIAEDDFRFWRKAFAAFVATPTRDEKARAIRARSLPPIQESYDSPASVAQRQQEEAARHEQEAREADARAAIAAMDPAFYTALKADAEPEVAQFNGRMTSEAYADAVRRVMVRLLVERRRDDERRARKAAAGA